MELAAGFAPVDADDWAESAIASLRGRPLGSLTTVTAERLRIAPVYGPDPVADRAGRPGVGSHTRGVTPTASGTWDVRALVADADIAAANATILDELQRGSTSVLIDRTAVGVTSAADLDAALDGVHLQMAAVALMPGPDGEHAARWLLDLWDDRGTPAAERAGALGLDPIGVAARHGGGIDLAGLAGLVDATADAPLVHAITVDGTVWSDGGAGPATEIAYTTATGVAYLRALTDAGCPLDRALAALTFTLSADADQFATMAKFRAARRVWARVAEACGAPEEARAQHQTAVTSAAMLSRRDPWVNLLRSAVAGFAAGVAGAQAVTVRAFDSAIGRSDEFGRRTARNTQLLLLEESGLARVVDPAGGSGYVEDLTDQMAGEGWRRFQAVDDRGMVDALASGWIAGELRGAWAGREARLAVRSEPLTGITEFPDLDAEPVERPAGPAPPAGPVPLRRLAEPFEDLRDRADAAAAPPVVHLVALGPLAEHSARAAFATNLFAVGGLRVDDDPGAPLAVVCGTDSRYVAEAVDAVAALKATGVRRVYLAGRPGDHEDAWRAAGVDEFIHAGCDVLDVLGRALDEALDGYEEA